MKSSGSRAFLPFGHAEDTATELQDQASKSQDTLVDAVETAEVAEIKRAVFRALTRLRAATIKEFDTIARLETQSIDAYNDAHHYRSENPLAHLHEDEAPVQTDKLKPWAQKQVEEGTAEDALRWEEGVQQQLQFAEAFARFPAACDLWQQSFLENFLQGMQELQDPAMPQYEVRELEPLIDSSAMGPSDWTKIARTLERNYMKYHGFVVITGTDTMAYAGSALSFMLEDLAKPVVFTGSMIPLAEPYNDARRNLILSMQFAAAQQSFPEVMIFFNDRLLRANRATKYSADGLDAFGSPNFPPLAIVGTSVRARTDLVVSNPRGYMKVHPVADAHVLVIRLVPGFDAGVLSMIVEGKQSLRALVLETYGTGNAPVLAAVAEARKRDLLVVVCSQCPQGCVEMNQYAAGAELAKQGVISAGDMTTEATVTKLTFLLSRYSTDQVAHRMGDDLRGEITPMDSADEEDVQMVDLADVTREGKRHFLTDSDSPHTPSPRSVSLEVRSSGRSVIFVRNRNCKLPPLSPSCGAHQGEEDYSLFFGEHFSNLCNGEDRILKQPAHFDYAPVIPNDQDQMRKAMLDRIVRLHLKFDMKPESLYLAVSLIDECLMLRLPCIRPFLLAPVALLVAAKFEDMRPGSLLYALLKLSAGIS
ncbi:ansA [Symbiodinium sp. CCMP2592]|nr:ansA [Symbiodinium sp. CCMP2592]